MEIEELKELRKLLEKWDNEKAQEIMKKYNLKIATRTQLIEIDDYSRVLEGCDILISQIDELLLLKR